MVQVPAATKLAVVPDIVQTPVVEEAKLTARPEVALALRADSWLHAHGDLRSAEAKPIKSMIRAAFHSNDVLWQGMALGQGLAACQAAVAGLLMTAG